jgi:hypothetical protein
MKVGRVSIVLAGIPVRDDLVVELANRLDRAGRPEMADKLQTALTDRRKLVALKIPERDTILEVIENPPAGLEDLRDVLLSQQLWRRGEGLYP